MAALGARGRARLRPLHLLSAALMAIVVAVPAAADPPLPLAEGAGETEALRFGAAVAGVKCTRIGGAGGMPVRTEVAALLAEG